MNYKDTNSSIIPCNKTIIMYHEMKVFYATLGKKLGLIRSPDNFNDVFNKARDPVT